MQRSEAQFLTVQQAANFLGVKVSTVRSWAKTGKLKGTRVGKKSELRFTKEELSPFIVPQRSNLKGHLQRKFDLKHPKQAEHRLEVLISSIDDILVTYDREWNLTFVNDSASRVLGKPQEELLGKNIWEIYPEEIGKNYYKELQTAVRTKRTIISEQYFSLIDRWFETHIYPFEDGVTVFASDITSRKHAEDLLRQSEKKYHTLMEQASDIIMLFNLDETIADVNHRACEAFGYTREELIGMVSSDLIVDEDKEATQKATEENKKGNPVILERKVRRKDGSVFYIESNRNMFGSDKVLSIMRDITKRKELEEKLKKSEASLAAAQSLAKIGSWEFDVTTTDRLFKNEPRWSDECYRIFGFQPGKVKITHSIFLSRVHPDDRYKLMHIIEKAFKDKKEYSVTYRILLANGHEKVIFETGKAIFDSNDNPMKMMGTAQDITEQRRAEEALQQSELRYKTLTNLAPVGIFETDADSACFYVNQKMCDLLGLTCEKIMGRGWIKALHPEDKERVFCEWWEAAEKKKEFISDYRIITPKGKITWLHGTGIALQTDGRVSGYIGTVTDITEKKSVSDRLEYYASLSQSITDAVVSTDTKYRVVSWNNGAEKLYGWKEVEVVGKYTPTIFETEYLNGITRKDFEEALKKKGSWQGEVLQKKRSGDIVQIFAVVSVIKNNEGIPVGFVAVNRDVTETKRLEKQKDEFISIASHELKTPLTSIKAYTQLLQGIQQKQGDKRSATYLGKVDTQLNKVTNLISDLLDVTKIREGKLQFKFHSFAFDVLVSDSVEAMQLTTEKHRLLIKGKTGKELYGDKERIGQVITNFLSNAIKYSPNGKKIIIHVSVEDTSVVLCVQDYGMGISREKQLKVFDRFYQVSSTKSQPSPGLGLGLYISSEIITRLGGRIWVESTVGKGSKFYFSLPIMKQPTPKKKLPNGIKK